ncbi:GumC family protein [Methylobacterium nodulans]|uniref:Lipopolysaccharide biosynthesis protein n=1 Tax=Methylobacterium nodulans (strain LMG 21967 / CNCM I-2342 / ORS 2060) TaxID=460265 RepID=B8IQC9_METNO|nr:polysaccharide biosynthesis tyrosine autokinase [Methylobacterium nodulans]ACL60441.1 lipopolysaccharide biosynthesis protein [Methylobacterium nodulans ORS 2060]
MNCVPEQQPKASSGLNLRQHYEAQSLGALTALWRHRQMIGGLIIAAMSVAVAACFVLRDRYTAEAMIQVDLARPAALQAGQAGQAGQAAQAAAALDASAIVESEARVIKSRSVARRVVDDLHLQDDPAYARSPGLLSRLLGGLFEGHGTAPLADAAAIEAERIAGQLSRGLTVSNDTRAYLITVAYTAQNPDRAAQFANAFVEAYQRNRLEMAVSEAERASAWLESRIHATGEELQQAEAAIETYRREAHFVESGSGGNLPQQELRDVQVQLVAAGQTRLAAEARLTRAKEIFASGGVPSAQDLTGAPVIQRMLESVETAKRELAGLSTTGPRHPRFLQAQAALADTEQRLHQEIDRTIGNLQSEVRSAAADEASLAARVDTLKSAVINAMGREAKLRSLQANAAAIRDRLKLLNDSHAQALALAGMTSSTAQVVMRARPVPTPSGPNRPLILGLTLIGSAVAGAGLSLLIERRDTGYRSGGEMAEETGARCLSMIPAITTASDAAAVRMFDEAVRLVAAALGWPHGPIAPQVLLVTSCVPQEGKSLLCMALAKLLAGRGTRTLVIDTAGPRLGAPDAPSLETVLAGDHQDFLDGLCDRPVVLLRTATGPDGGDRLLSESFEAFLALARDSFDVVLIEAPPAMLVVDVAPLARLSDAVVLAVRWGRTPRRTVMATLQRLQDLSIRIRGLVLTQVDLDQHRYERFADQCAHYAAYRPFFETCAASVRDASRLRGRGAGAPPPAIEGSEEWPAIGGPAEARSTGFVMTQARAPDAGAA